MVTLKQIATTVGVSQATVSRVLNFDATLSVTQQTRQAVIEAAEALNYATPRARQRQRAGTGPIKVAMAHFLRPDQELADPYYVGVRLGIESRCAALQIECVKIYHSEAMPEARLLAQSSGVICIGAHNDAEVAWFKAHALHIVCADFIPKDDEIDAVESDRALAMRKLLRALTDMGYRRIGFAGWWDHDYQGRIVAEEARCKAYVAFMRDAGLFDPAICLTDFNTEDSGYRLTKAIMACANRPDALITGNDNMAVGSYRALHELGLRVPDDIAIASFNDISVAQFMNPPLSTVRLPSEEIGETAVDLLVERINGRDIAKRTTLASRILWRGSTRQPVGE